MSSARCFFGFVLFILPAFLFSIVVCFSIMSESLPNQVQKAIGAIKACQMDDLLYPARSIDHLDFSPIKGIFLGRRQKTVYRHGSAPQRSTHEYTLTFEPLSRR